MTTVMYAPKTAQPFISASLADAWVHEALEPDQLSNAKKRFGRARLTAGTVALLWGLRLYVLLMTFLIGLEVWNVVKSGG